MKSEFTNPDPSPEIDKPFNLGAYRYASSKEPTEEEEEVKEKVIEPKG